MDELKHRAGEKLEALHIAAKTAADGGKSRVQDVVSHATDTVRKIREAFQELWQNELFAESRERVAAFTRDAIQRIREGTPPLSPVLLYEELVALFKDRVWRRSVVIFALGALVGGGAGVCVGLRCAARAPAGPHARALHSHADQSVILVEDAVTPGAGTGEVLIRVQAFSVSPVDRSVLRGRGSALRSLITRTQLTVGRGFTGVVLDVGHGVTEFEMGDEVWGCVSEWAGGAASELLTVRSTRVSKRPRSVSADGAAALPWAGAQALAALQLLALAPNTAKGKRVAICGAASGEGCVLVQLLGAWGAHLTVLAPRHAALTLQDLGAAEFVDAGAEGSCWQALGARAARAGPWHAALACAGALAAHDYPANAAALLKSGDGGARRDLGPAAEALHHRPAARTPLAALRRLLLLLEGAEVGVRSRHAHGLAGGSSAAAARPGGAGAAGGLGPSCACTRQGVHAPGLRECACARVQRGRDRHHRHPVPLAPRAINKTTEFTDIIDYEISLIDRIDIEKSLLFLRVKSHRSDFLSLNVDYSFTNAAI